MNQFGFNIDSVLSFGLYKGYQVGIVYAFDIKYIEWCIINIKTFYINDLESLQEIGAFRERREYSQGRDIGIPAFDILMNDYKSINDLAEDIPFSNSGIRLSEEIYNMNEGKRAKFRSA